MPITVTATQIGDDGEETTLFAREYATLTGTRKGLVAAIVRECGDWSAAPDWTQQTAERLASRWDANTIFDQTVRDQIRFVAR